MIHLVAGYMLMTVLNIYLIFIFIYCYKCCCRLSLFGLGICVLPGTRMIFFRPNISKVNMVCSYRTSQLLKWHKSLWILKKNVPFQNKTVYGEKCNTVENDIWQLLWCMFKMYAYGSKMYNFEPLVLLEVYAWNLVKKSQTLSQISEPFAISFYCSGCHWQRKKRKL